MWRDWVRWQGRSLELGTLHDGESGPYIQTNMPVKGELAIAWRKLPRIPLVFEAMHGGDALRLRYVALDGEYRRASSLGDECVTMGLDLVSQLQLLRDAAAPNERRLFANPHAYVDFNGNARLTFDEAPAGVDGQELTFVKAFGRLMEEVVDFSGQTKSPLSVLVKQCKGGARTTLHDVRFELRKLHGGDYKRMDEAGWNARRQLEQMIGYDLVGNGTMARLMANYERHKWPCPSAADAIVEEIATGIARSWDEHGPIYPRPTTGPREVDLATLDQTRDFAAAIAYLQHRRTRTDDEQLALARCHLALHQHVPAVQQVRLAHPSTARFAIEVEALLALERTAELLVAADAWLALAPSEPRAHNARAHALLALCRVEEARAAHDVAAQRGYLPSQFARTNLDRAVKRLASVAGTQGYRELPVPEHLRELVPLLSQGRLLDAILWLTDRYADPEARALLATCYEYAGDADSALHVHEADDNRAGIARCLIALGRRDEAFARVGDDAALLDELRELAGLPAERIAWNR